MSHVLISHASDGAARLDAVRDLWIVLRASGLDARLLPASSEAMAAADVATAGMRITEARLTSTPGRPANDPKRHKIL
ncbi:hypothetical protein [Catellatospora citrea]|nr:hypothetical protein [Catellatospora citrea]